MINIIFLKVKKNQYFNTKIKQIQVPNVISYKLLRIFPIKIYRSINLLNIQYLIIKMLI